MQEGSHQSAMVGGKEGVGNGTIPLWHGEWVNTHMVLGSGASTFVARGSGLDTFMSMGCEVDTLVASILF